MKELSSKSLKLLSDLTSAIKQLEEAVVLPPIRIHKDGTIQRFEFCFELSWKLLQEIAKTNGLEIYGPRESIRAGARLGMIENPELWFSFLESRNQTTHVYNEAISDEVYEQAKRFAPVASQLISLLK